MPANGGRVAQQFAPVFHRAVRGHHRARPLVASHHDFQEFFGRGQRQPAHAEVIDDEQRHGEQGLQEVFALADEGRFGGEDSSLRFGGHPGSPLSRICRGREKGECGSLGSSPKSYKLVRLRSGLKGSVPSGIMSVEWAFQ